LKLSLFILASLLLVFYFSASIRSVNASPDTVTLNPNGNGSYIEWTLVDSTHWGATSDSSDATFVQTVDNVKMEQVHLADTSQTGTINSVTAYARALAYGSGTSEQFKIRWDTHAVLYESGAKSVSRSAFTNYNEIRTVNPYTSAAWTWTEVNALQIGARATNLAADEDISVSKFWAVVDYTVGGGTSLKEYGSITVATAISSRRTWTETTRGSIAVTISEASSLRWSFSRASLITIQVQLDSTRAETFFRNSLIQFQGAIDLGRTWTFSVSSLISVSMEIRSVFAGSRGQTLLNFFGSIVAGLGLSSSSKGFPFLNPQLPTDEEGGGIINRVVPVPWNMLIIPLAVFMGFILVFVDRYRDRKWKKKMWRRIKQEEKETLGFVDDVLKEEKEK
jgi:hypothetical protein